MNYILNQGCSFLEVTLINFQFNCSFSGQFIYFHSQHLTMTLLHFSLAFPKTVAFNLLSKLNFFFSQNWISGLLMGNNSQILNCWLRSRCEVLFNILTVHFVLFQKSLLLYRLIYEMHYVNEQIQSTPYHPWHRETLFNYRKE